MSNKGLGAKIISLRKKGMVYNEISKVLQCSKGTINYHCKDTELINSGQKLPVVNDDLKRQIRDFCKNHTAKQAKVYFGLGLATIYKFKNFKG